MAVMMVNKSKLGKGSGYFPLSYANFGLSTINTEVGLALVVLVEAAKITFNSSHQETLIK